VRAGHRSSRIRPVKGRRALLAVVVYVTLDLSLPAMPGAFVFEPADSVESAQRSREHVAGDLRLVPVPLRAAAVPTLPRLEHGPRSDKRPGLAELCAVRRLPRAVLAPAPPSEDPL
jgi:hypothetical protein